MERAKELINDRTKFQAYVMARFPQGEYSGRNEWQIRCPRCRHEKPRAYINLLTGAANCFHCIFSASDWWSLISFVEKKPGTTTAERWFRDQTNFNSFNYEVRTTAAQVRAPMRQEMPPEFRQFSYRFGLEKHTQTKEERPYYNYIHKIRKINHDDIKTHQMGYAITGKYAGRVLIPVVNDNALEFFGDRLVPGIGRDNAEKTIGVGDKDQKWPIDKERILFGVDGAKAILKENPSAIIPIAEGIFSALSIGSGCIALLGKECSDFQLKRLLDLEAKAFMLNLDPDTERNVASLAFRLKRWGRQVLVRRFTQGDPNDYLVKEIPLPPAEPWTAEDDTRAAQRGHVKITKGTW